MEKFTRHLEKYYKTGMSKYFNWDDYLDLLEGREANEDGRFIINCFPGKQVCSIQAREILDLYKKGQCFNSDFPCYLRFGWRRHLKANNPEELEKLLNLYDTIFQGLRKNLPFIPKG